MNRRNDDYAFLSAIYDPLTAPFLDPVRRSLCRLLEHSQPTRVLDLCCGTGRLCILLKPTCPFVLGLDSSPAMLRIARRKSPKTIAYLLADAARPPLKASSFDAVVISLALHEKGSRMRQAVLRAGSGLLRPGGLLYALELHPPGSGLKSRFIHAFIHGVERAAGKNHFQSFSSFLRQGGIDGLLNRTRELKVIEERRFFSDNLKLVVARSCPKRLQDEAIASL